MPVTYWQHYIFATKGYSIAVLRNISLSYCLENHVSFHCFCFNVRILKGNGNTVTVYSSSIFIFMQSSKVLFNLP